MNDLETFFNQFEHWVLKDIRNLLKLEDDSGQRLEPDRNTYDTHRPFVAAVILMCCAIDVLAAFRYGKIDGGVGGHFKNFIKDYFKAVNTKSKKSYDASHIYIGLRNALVHGYSLGKDLALIHTDENKHLEMIGNRVQIDVFMFYYDIESVYFKYKQELEDGKYIEEFNKRWSFAPLIQFIAEENLKR